MKNEPVKLNDPVSILMPVCNEADIIEMVIDEWYEDVIKHLPEGSELLFDEAASKDGTREILQRLQSTKYPFIRVMSQDVKDGFGNAAKRLYSNAKCPLIFFTDSDGQYVAADFWKLAKHIDRYDMVHGAKLGRKDPFYRRFFSIIFNKLATFLFEEHYLDLNSAFKLTHKRVVDDILPQLKVMPTLLNAEFLLRCEFANYEIKQIYVLHRDRKFGKSRGLPGFKYFWEGYRACRGLFTIKESYRKND